MSNNQKLTVMKKLRFLKTLIDIFWFFSLLAAVTMIGYLLYSYFQQGPLELPLKINGEPITDFGFSTQFMLTLGFIAYAFFVYGIHLFRKLLRLFEHKIIFEQQTIRLLHQIGRNFTAASLLSWFALFVYDAFHDDSKGIDFSSGFNSFLFTVSLGLFFMVLSEVFAIAKNMKEENELTV